MTNTRDVITEAELRRDEYAYMRMPRVSQIVHVMDCIFCSRRCFFSLLSFPLSSRRKYLISSRHFINDTGRIRQSVIIPVTLTVPNALICLYRVSRLT